MGWSGESSLSWGLVTWDLKDEEKPSVRNLIGEATQAEAKRVRRPREAGAWRVVKEPTEGACDSLGPGQRGMRRGWRDTWVQALQGSVSQKCWPRPTVRDVFCIPLSTINEMLRRTKPILECMRTMVLSSLFHLSLSSAVCYPLQWVPDQPMMGFCKNADKGPSWKARVKSLENYWKCFRRGGGEHDL